MRRYKILRDCHLKDQGLHPATQTTAPLHNSAAPTRPRWPDRLAPIFAERNRP